MNGCKLQKVHKTKRRLILLINVRRIRNDHVVRIEAAVCTRRVRRRLRLFATRAFAARHRRVVFRVRRALVLFVILVAKCARSARSKQNAAKCKIQT